MDHDRQEQRSGSAVGAQAKRRRYTNAQKVAIVRECLVPGTSLAGVALAHRANANMVRKWVLKYQQGAYGQIPEMGTAMLPVVVRKRSHVNAPPKYAAPTPVLEIELARGVVRFYGAIDATVLCGRRQRVGSSI